MSQVTADLEFFKCDVCGVYLHKDIFCNHRRECKGSESQEISKRECLRIEQQLNDSIRGRLEQLKAASEGPHVLFDERGSCGAESGAFCVDDASPAGQLDSGGGTEKGRDSECADLPSQSSGLKSGGAKQSGIVQSVFLEERRLSSEVRRRIAEEYQERRVTELNAILSDRKLSDLMAEFNL